LNPFFLFDYMNNCSYNIDVMRIATYKVKRMKSILKVVADETRLLIMSSLLNENKCKSECNCSCCKNLSCMVEKCVSQIMKETNKSQSLVSHQLKVLKDAKIVKTRKEKQRVYYSLKDGHIKALLNVVIEHVEEE